MQDEEQVDYSKIEPSADFFAPPRGLQHMANLLELIFLNKNSSIDLCMLHSFHAADETSISA